MSTKLIFKADSKKLIFEDRNPKLVFADEFKKLIFDVTPKDNEFFPYTFPFNLS